MLADILGWVAGLSAVYLPMKLCGVTGSNELTGAAFVEIYAQLRHPHHLVPTFWGWSAWLQATAFYAGGVACCLRLGPPMEQNSRWLLRGILLSTAGLLLVNYLGVELWPNAFLTKLQFARATPFAQLAMLAGLTWVVQGRIGLQDYAGAATLALAPLSPYPGALLLLAAVLLAGAGAAWSWRQGVLLLAVLLSFYQPTGIEPGVVWFYGTCVAAFLALLVPAGLVDHPGRMVSVALVALAAALGSAAWSMTPTWPKLLAGRFNINAPPFDIPGILGQRFEQHSPIDAVVLVPPDRDVWAFKLYARRAIVVDLRHFPFSDHGIAEWRRRISEIVGVPFERGLDIDAAWAAQTPQRLATVAAKYGARYVMTCDRWHPQFPGRRIEHLHGWSIWELPDAGAPPH